ncbi:MAG TPA: glycoside hydrolase family 28 protein [Puia sp.]|nr:glycoside hydrolase family 28 protein [Puia sp.]
MNAPKTIARTLATLAGFSALLALPGSRANAQPVLKELSWYIAHAPFSMPPVAMPQFPTRDFNITDYGGNADGQSLNTDAFAKAIKACSDAGGGRVIVPAGTWLTGPIQLLSHVNLHLEAGVLIQFTGDHAAYTNDLDHGTNSPIYSVGCEDIAITGEGILDGSGQSWRPVKKGKMTAAQWSALQSSGGFLSPDGKIWWPSRDVMENDRLRPYMVSFNKCSRILIQGVTLRNSPKFVFCPQHCTDLTVDHAHIFNEWWAQNGDGMDISACKRVIIYGCTVNAGDDGICMKSSGLSPDGPALEDIIIAGCTVFRAHGGFVIGSNTDGGMHDIFVSDCTFIGTDVGLRFKSNTGRGGLVNDIFVSDITMKNIVNEAVLFDTYYEDAPAGATHHDHPNDKIPQFTDFHISHIDCQGAKTAISITGLPQMPVSNIAFDSLTIHATKGLTATQARNIDLHDVQLDVAEKPVYQTDRTAEIKVH